MLQNRPFLADFGVTGTAYSQKSADSYRNLLISGSCGRQIVVIGELMRSASETTDFLAGNLWFLACVVLQAAPAGAYTAAPAVPRTSLPNSPGIIQSPNCSAGSRVDLT